MQSYSFTAYGHPNIKATHKTTLEFTKDEEVTPQGDCIVGVKADYDLSKIKEFISNLKKKKVQITIEVNEVSEQLEGLINPDFNDEKELVIRTTPFISQRTLLICASKSAQDLSKGVIRKLRNSKQEVIISLH